MFPDGSTGSTITVDPSSHYHRWFVRLCKLQVWGKWSTQAPLAPFFETEVLPFFESKSVSFSESFKLETEHPWLSEFEQIWGIFRESSALFREDPIRISTTLVKWAETRFCERVWSAWQKYSNEQKIQWFLQCKLRGYVFHLDIEYEKLSELERSFARCILSIGGK